MTLSYLTIVNAITVSMYLVHSLQIDGNTTNYRPDQISAISSVEGDLGKWDGTKLCQHGQFAMEYANTFLS